MGQPQIISGRVRLEVVCAFFFKSELLKFNYYVSIDGNTECLCFLNSLMLELSKL